MISISSENAILAKSRAMYGKRLTEQNMRDMLKCQSVQEVASYLKTKTSYAGVLESISPSVVHRGQLEVVLKAHLFDECAALCRYDFSRRERVSEYLIMRAEIQQLLAFLRMIVCKTQEEYWLKLSSYYNRHSDIDFPRLATAQTVEEFASVISKTRYAGILMPYCGLEEEGLNYADIEAALYKYMYCCIFKNIQTTSNGSEKREMTELFGTVVDMLNFTNIYRLKKYFNADSQKVRSFVIPEYYAISKKVMDLLIEAQTADDVLNLMIGHTKYSKALKDNPFETMDAFAEQQRYNVSKKLIRFSVNPAVVMASYTFLAEIEIVDIINIIEGIRYSLPEEAILRLIINLRKNTD